MGACAQSGAGLGVLTRAVASSEHSNAKGFFCCIEQPDKIADRQFGKLYCTTPVHMLSRDVVSVYSFHPTVIMSTNNKIVITAYLGGGC